jgi:hypothetical protein
MRPTLDIRPLTLAVNGPLAGIAKVDSITFQADHGWTPKGWAPAVRPLSRRNACAALVASIHASDEPRAMETWQALCAADASAMLAVALALPIWARPGKVVEGWSHPTHADHGCRTMVEGAIVAEVARLTAATMATMDSQAWEACQPRPWNDSMEEAHAHTWACARDAREAWAEAHAPTCALPPMEAAPKAAPKAKGKGKGK